MVKVTFSESKRKIKFINKQRRHKNFFSPKSFNFLNLKDFKFYKYIVKMYILADIKRNCRKSRFIYEQRRLSKKIFEQKIHIFLFERFYIL